MSPPVSVLRELRTVAAAIDGARCCLETVRNGVAASERDEQLARDASVAVLHLVALRLRDLDRLITGEIDPATFASGHNDAGAVDDVRAGEPDGDVVLHPWDAERQAAHARADLRRAQRQLDRQRNRSPVEDP